MKQTCLLSNNHSLLLHITANHKLRISVQSPVSHIYTVLKHHRLSSLKRWKFENPRATKSLGIKRVRLFTANPVCFPRDFLGALDIHMVAYSFPETKIIQEED